MNKEIEKFLETGLLEEYVLGIIDENRIPEVEKHIRASPEVRSLYEQLQKNVEILAAQVSTPPPPGTKKNILREIQKMDNPSNTVSAYSKFWAMVASLVAVVSLPGALYLFQQKTNLQNDYKALENQYAALQDECAEKQQQIALEQQQWMIMADPKTQRFLLKGNEKASELETVAYWNKESQNAYLRIIDLPDLPTDKCFQLWADVAGKMVSVQILPDKTGVVQTIPFKANASSLNITIEPAKGSDHPTILNLVASVAI